MPRHICVFAAFLGVLACALPPSEHAARSGAAAVSTSGSAKPLERQVMSFDTPSWQAIDQLVAAQQLEAAREKLAELRAAAERDKNAADWTRALVREAQLQLALGRAETAVRELRRAAWPDDAMSQLVLELYYADVLMRYLGGYSYEIAQRARVQSQGVVDIAVATREQIVAEALGSLQRVWERRETLGLPADALGPYLKQNNYPAGIRDSLRDVLSYHVVELLADTGNWTPAQENEVYRVDQAALLRVQPEPRFGVADAGLHPIARASHVLHDLAAWHSASNRPAAALEAELARLRLLHGAFSERAARESQLVALDALIARSHALPWSAMAQLLRAQWSQEQGALVRARSQADACAKAYPEELGGKACAALVAQIEAPSFTLHAMRVDGPEQRSLEVQHKNLKQLYFRAYRDDVLKRLQSAADHGLWRTDEDVKQLLQKEPFARWRVSLEDPGDYDAHRTFVNPPLPELGFYYVFASALPDFAVDQDQIQMSQLFVSELSVRTRRDSGGGLDIQVLEGSTGAPASGAEVVLYQLDWQHPGRQLGVQALDASGRARWNEKNDGGQNVMVFARRGQDVCGDLQYQWLGSQPASQDESSAFVFTDRSVYRPGQKVQWKVLAYRGRATSWRNLTRKPISVSLQDPNGEVVGKLDVTTNDYGTASGSFVIPTGRLLGQWSITHTLGGGASVQVEEYKRPTFEVKLAPSDGAARLNQPVTVRGEATYYFGMPVQDAPFQWKVERRERFPWWWGSWRMPTRAPQVVAAGAGKLDAQGKLSFTFTPSADPNADKSLQYVYHVAVDLTDEGGETRSASRDFAVGHSSVDAHLELDGGFVVAGQAAKLALRRENLDGDARPGAGTYRVVRLAQPKRAVPPAELPLREVDLAADGSEKGVKNERKTLEGDTQRSRARPGYALEQELASWGEDATLVSEAVTTAADGKASITLPELPSGAYRVHYESADEAGAKLAVKREFLVAGAKTPLALPAVLQVERSVVQPGEVARVLVTSGLDAQQLWLEIYRGWELIERRALPPGSSALQELRIGPQHRGGLTFVLVGMRDYQSLQQQATLLVPWDDRELNVELSSFRDLLRPGSKETFRVTVRGKRDKALVSAAELLGYMYDRSLDAFQPHVPPAPWQLFPTQSMLVPDNWTIGESGTRSVSNPPSLPLPAASDLRGDALEFPDAYGIGGPGGRGYGGGVRHSMLREMLAEGAVAPRPAPQAAAAQAAELLVAAGAANVLAVGGAVTADAVAPDAGRLRSNFAETAFFSPHLITGPDGSAALEVSVPDSVTSWSVWVHAITRDFRSGSTRRETRTVKELLVRPYLPRFMREGDRAVLKVMVQNSSKAPLSGTLRFELTDPQTDRPLNSEFGVTQSRYPFEVPASGSTTLAIPVVAPKRVGDVALRVVGEAGGSSDGELRPLPLLPSRLHLTQSQFVSLRGDGSQRSLQLQDLASQSDPTRSHEQLVLSVEAQLFMTVLKALPFLIDYPYECSEQTLNRFLSAAIVSSVFAKHPTVRQMAAELVKHRDSLLDKFAAPDPNRKLQLEESPWLVQAQGGPELDGRLIRVLDPSVAQQERDRALARLREMQTASGGFPWFPGGPPSPYMTAYLMMGMARASEFGVAVPEDLVQRAWQYLAQHYRSDIVKQLKAADAPVELITLLHYAISAYPDPKLLADAFTPEEAKQMLDYAFARWKELSPLLKSVLATSLIRANRKQDAGLVFAAVMDSAQTTQDEGTFWKPEDKAWLWYNDRIETHAFALRTLLELNDKDPKLEGMVVWLLLNKKLNQWKSTRATAEVIYSLTRCLEHTSAIGQREQVTLQVGERDKQALTFEPAQYTGKSQLVIAGADVKSSDAKINVSKQGPGVAFVSATWHYATDQLPTQARGDLFQVKRSYFKREAMQSDTRLIPLAPDSVLHPGDEVEVQLEIEARAQAEYVQLRDPRPAGLEPALTTSGYRYDLGIVYYEEVRDAAQSFFVEWLPAGRYTLKYRLRANLAGQFRVGPATLQSMYAPEFAAFSAGQVLQVQ